MKKTFPKWLMDIAFSSLLLIFTVASPFANGHSKGQKMKLTEVLTKLTKKYQVYFTYDKSLVDHVNVDYANSGQSFDAELSSALSQTDLKFRVFDSRFVIIYKSDAAGLESLRKMVDQFTSIIEEQSSTGKQIKNTEILNVLQSRIEAQRNFADDFQIKGKIVDEKGQPLVGVSIKLKNKLTGTTSDADGKFTLDVADKKDILVASYIGFVTQETIIGDAKTFDIVLREDQLRLNEVVVVGYGQQRKSDITGSVASVSAKDYKAEPVVSFTQALQGRAAGVVVTNSSGAPGGPVKVRIRGANSLLGNNDPLYVIDGVASNVGITSINPNDIESMEVLKDASATAIYGNRGSNGVIMITTKQGKAGKTVVQAEMNVGVSSLARKYDLMNAGQYAEMVNVYRPGNFSAQQIADFKAKGGTDWQDAIYQKGYFQNYQASVSGGSQDVKYFISGGYVNQSGVMLRSSQNKYNFRTNVSAKISKRFTIDLNLFVNRTKGLNNLENGSKGAPAWTAAIFSPTLPIFGADGTYNKQDALSTPNSLNPYMVLKERYDDNLSNVIVSNARLSYNIFDDLKFDVVFGINNSSDLKSGYANLNLAPVTTAYQNEGKVFSWQNSNILTYHKKIAKHDLTITAVNEQLKNSYRFFSAAGTDIDPISVGYDNLGIAKNKNARSEANQYSLQSYLGRLGYSFNDRYLLTATIRADGTSKFSKANKWGYFPSAALGWRVSEESFLANSTVISNLKLRASWGITGNQDVNPYATIARIGSMYSTYGLSQAFPGAIIVGLDNPDLKWETTEQKNIGADISVLKNRLNLSLDLFEKNTTDLLKAVVIPAYNGGGTVNRNLGKIRNRGIEINLGGTPVQTENFRWDANLNLTSVRSKVLDLGADSLVLGGNYAGGLTQESPFVLKKGEQLGAFWGYDWLGVYSSAEADVAAKYGFKPGDNKYLDYNKDGVIDSKDKHVIGHAMPKVIIGFNNTFTYKNLSLNVMMIGQQGSRVLNTTYAAAATILSDATSITHVDGMNYWTPQNDHAKFANPASSSNKNLIESTQFLDNASFLKVKNVALNYTIPRSVLKVVDLGIVLSAQNLLTITKYRGYDPETSTSSTDADGTIDVGAYPSSRTITFGLKATF